MGVEAGGVAAVDAQIEVAAVIGASATKFYPEQLSKSKQRGKKPALFFKFPSKKTQ
jgi:N-acetylneuraminic acid mutarotase